jgi:AcrR family transcriptional regulator
MRKAMTEDQTAARRAKVLAAARWCFLNFGFGKTSFDDIAQRADLSRTLLYRLFKDKDDIYRAVFADWVLSREPAALNIAGGSGDRCERLLSLCNLMALDPWTEMVSAPMGREFFDVCERIDPESEARYRKVLLKSVNAVLKDALGSQVFLLALDGLFVDRPSVEVLKARTKVLCARFAAASPRKGRRT